jgi:tetratricopeptide (TPR) repeat protein
MCAGSPGDPVPPFGSAGAVAVAMMSESSRKARGRRTLFAYRAGLLMFVVIVGNAVAQLNIPALWKSLTVACVGAATFGVEYVRERRSIGSGGEGPEADPGSAVADNRRAFLKVPPDLPDFTGRHELADELVRLIRPDARETPAVVALFGQAGVGKTALAIRVAHLARDGFVDGQLYVNLRGPERQRLSPDDVVVTALHRLGVEPAAIPETFDEALSLYQQRIAGRRLLLLFDNAEDDTQVRPLLPWSATVAALVTSRRAMAGLDGALLRRVEVLETPQSVELLRTLAGRDRVDAEPVAADRVAFLCGNLPLAVRIAGRKLALRPEWKLSTLGTRLESERRRLAELRVGDLAVRASFSISYEETADGIRKAFRRLGLINATDFPSWVLAPLLDAGTDHAASVMEQLVDAELVRDSGTDLLGLPRYRFHDLLRAFARERLDEEEDPDERASALVRLLGAYLWCAERADARLRPGLRRTIETGTAARWALDDRALLDAIEESPLAWYTSERFGLAAALEQASEARLWATTWELAGTLADSYDLRGLWKEWQRSTEIGLVAARAAGDGHAQAYMLHSLGLLDRYRGRWEAGLRHFQESLTLFRSLPERDEAWAAHTIREIGILQQERGELDEAVRRLQECLPIFQRLGERRWEAYTLYRLGGIRLARQQLDEARPLIDASLQIARDIGDDRVEAMDRHALGDLDLKQARTQEAAESFRASLDYFRRVGDQLWIARNLTALGDVAHAVGDAAAAHRHWRDAAELLEELESPEADRVTARIRTGGPDDRTSPRRT